MSEMSSPAMQFHGANIISVDQFNLASLEKLFSVAEQLEPVAARQKICKVLDGAVLGNLFFEPSTRTRLSFGVAFNRLGGQVQDMIGTADTSISKGESISDTARIVSGYVDVIAVRHPDEGAVAEFAAVSDRPVINSGDGPGEHPSQALLDTYTMYKELGRDLQRLHNIKVAVVGDLKHGRTVHSLAKLLTVFNNVEFNFIAPESLQMPDDIVAQLENDGHTVKLTTDLATGVKNVDIVYVTRIQEERFKDWNDYAALRGKYCINKLFFAQHCKPDAVIMHPLPRDSRPGSNELDEDLTDHPQLAAFRQAENGVPVRMAMFALVLGVEDKIAESLSDPLWLKT